MDVTFSQSDFRATMAQYATGVLIVTTTHKNKLLGLTVNSFTSVSLDPPLVLFCLKKTSFSYGIFSKSPTFTVNVLSHHQGLLAKHFANHETKDWNEVEYHLSPRGNPLIKGCLSHVECERYNLFDGGDHGILVGRVIGILKNLETDPLVFFRSQFLSIKD